MHRKDPSHVVARQGRSEGWHLQAETRDKCCRDLRSCDEPGSLARAIDHIVVREEHRGKHDRRPVGFEKDANRFSIWERRTHWDSVRGYGGPNFAAKIAFTAIAESTEPKMPGRSVYSSSTAAIAIDGCSNEAKPMNQASTLPVTGDSAVPLFPAVLVEYVRKTEDTVPSRSVVTACIPSRMSERSVGIESTEPACVFG